MVSSMGPTAETAFGDKFLTVRGRHVEPRRQRLVCPLLRRHDGRHDHGPVPVALARMNVQASPAGPSRRMSQMPMGGGCGPSPNRTGRGLAQMRAAGDGFARRRAMSLRLPGGDVLHRRGKGNEQFVVAGPTSGFTSQRYWRNMLSVWPRERPFRLTEANVSSPSQTSRTWGWLQQRRRRRQTAGGIPNRLRPPTAPAFRCRRQTDQVCGPRASRSVCTPPPGPVVHFCACLAKLPRTGQRIGLHLFIFLVRRAKRL